MGLVGLIGRARDGYRPSIQPWQVSFEVWQQKRRASKPFQPPRNGRADRCIREAGKERAGLSQKERLGTRDLREVRTVRVEEGWASQKRPNGPGRHEAQPVQEKSRYPPKSLVMHGNTQQRPTGRCDLRARFDTLPSQVWWEWHKGAGGVRCGTGNARARQASGCPRRCLWPWVGLVAFTGPRRTSADP